MLITCPECQSQVSDKALACPHCGFPLQVQSTVPVAPVPRKRNKRRRLPNGFGQITEIKNRNLRKPFRVMVTVGKSDDGKPICKPLHPQAYFETYNDAYLALMSFNRNPFDLSSKMTMEELYEQWIAQKEGTVDRSTIYRYHVAWKYSEPIHSKLVCDVKISDLKNCIEYGTIIRNGKEVHPKNNSKESLKTLYNLLFDYAVACDLVPRNIARQFTINSGYVRTPKHIPYTDAEMAKLWENLDKYPYIDMILIQCYSGWRPRELCNLTLSNVDLANRTFTGGQKTSAGKNRVVPIHSRIFNLVEARYKKAIELGSEYLFCEWSRKALRQLSYQSFWKKHHDIIVALQLNPEHKCHDGRKHFITTAKASNMDEYAIKRIVGHYINDLTERVYTQRSIEWLRSEIEKIH